MDNAKTGITLGIEATINLAISGFLNALCAWLLYRDAQFVPVDFWSLLIDTTITCFLVSVCTAPFATASAKRYLRQGMRVSAGPTLERFLAALPEAAFPTGCCLFGMCLPVLVAVFGIAFGIAATVVAPLGWFMVFKGLWGGLYGAFVCLVIIVRHLALKRDDHDRG